MVTSWQLNIPFTSATALALRCIDTTKERDPGHYVDLADDATVTGVVPIDKRPVSGRRMTRR